ncbi:ribonuclease HII [Candidatus Sumerlaeota bacterium]|nr:ribonuclease HII [Candidatus Sumerlaeota bacterium]
MTVPSRPSIRVEKDFAAQCGGAWVAGVDEAGRGPLAGPVVAAAVMLPHDQSRRPVGLRDSKELTQEKRERLFPKITRMAISYGIGIATAQEIDLYNILEATRLAAKRAIAMLSPVPGALVTDALTFPGEERPVLPLVKGDAICASISAASILAKVTRDRLMAAYAEEFPQYGWLSNRGYPTEEHYAALAAHGPTVLHRMTFQGVGFFAESPRRSPTFLSIRDRFSRIRGDHQDNTPESWRRVLAECENRLPPPDLLELQTLIEERFATKEPR